MKSLTEYYCIITFNSTYHALKFEKIFKEKGLSVKLMPVPRQISSSCGTAAEISCDDEDNAIKITKEFDIEIDKLHRLENKRESNWFNKFLKAK